MIKYSNNENSLTKKGFYNNLETIKEPKENNFYEFFVCNNKDRLSKRAMVCGGKTITYQNIIDMVEDYAGKLNTLGVKQGDSIFMLSMPTPEASALVLAANKLDVCVIMLSPSPDNEKLGNLIDNEKIKYAFISESFLGACFGMKSLMEKCTIYQLPHDVYCKNEYKVNNDYNNQFGFAKTWDKFIQIEGNPQPTVLNPKNISYVAEAPGVIPKGISYSHKAMIYSSLMITNCQIGFKEDDLYVSRIFMNAMACTSLQLLCPMAVGVAICANVELPFQDAVIVPDDMLANHPSAMILQYSSLYPVLMSDKLASYDFSTLKTIYNFGEYFPLDKMKDVLERVKELGGKTGVKNCYGLSEANSIITAEKPGLELSSSAGSPCPSCRVYIINPETEEELPLGSLGEIVYHSPAMMDGYYKNLEATNARLTKDEKGLVYDKTGDLGKMDEDGNLYLMGRSEDRFITHKGEICYLATIKSLLNHDTFKSFIPTASNGKVTIHFLSDASDNELKKAFDNIKNKLIDSNIFSDGIFFVKKWEQFPQNHGRVRSDLLKAQSNDADSL